MNTYQRWGKSAGAAFFKLDVWIAPAFDREAMLLITTPTEKRKWGTACRLLAVDDLDTPPDPRERDYKKIAGGMLVQTRDLLGLNEEQWQVVTRRSPSEEEWRDLRLAWLICKHTKSNAISLVKDGMLIGNGAGQMSRVDSVRIAAQKAAETAANAGLAQPLTHGSVVASDAFYPFADGIEAAIRAGATAAIQPGGSRRDAEVIEAADRAGIAMVFTGIRHFRH